MARGRKPTAFDGIKSQLDKIEKLAWHGFTNEEIADFIGVAQSTFYEFLKKFPDIAESIKMAKTEADLEVEQSLFKRAKGYDYVEETIEYEPGKSIENAKIKTVKKVKKHVPADPFSATVWLNNRQSGRWKRNRDSGNSLDSSEVTNLKLLAAKQSRENL